MELIESCTNLLYKSIMQFNIEFNLLKRNCRIISNTYGCLWGLIKSYNY